MGIKKGKATMERSIILKKNIMVNTQFETDEKTTKEKIKDFINKDKIKNFLKYAIPIGTAATLSVVLPYVGAPMLLAQAVSLATSTLGITLIYKNAKIDSRNSKHLTLSQYKKNNIDEISNCYKGDYLKYIKEVDLAFSTINMKSKELRNYLKNPDFYGIIYEIYNRKTGFIHIEKSRIKESPSAHLTRLKNEIRQKEKEGVRLTPFERDFINNPGNYEIRRLQLCFNKEQYEYNEIFWKLINNARLGGVGYDLGINGWYDTSILNREYNGVSETDLTLDILSGMSERALRRKYGSEDLTAMLMEFYDVGNLEEAQKLFIQPIIKKLVERFYGIQKALDVLKEHNINFAPSEFWLNDFCKKIYGKTYNQLLDELSPIYERYMGDQKGRLVDLKIYLREKGVELSCDDNEIKAIIKGPKIEGCDLYYITLGHQNYEKGQETDGFGIEHWVYKHLTIKQFIGEGIQNPEELVNFALKTLDNNYNYKYKIRDNGRISILYLVENNIGNPYFIKFIISEDRGLITAIHMTYNEGRNEYNNPELIT